MLWLATAKLAVEKVACPPLTAPVPKVAVPSLNVTVPVGVLEVEALGVTVAVNVIDWPNTAGLAETAKAVVVATAVGGVWFTVSDSAVEVLLRKLASPP